MVTIALVRSRRALAAAVVLILSCPHTAFTATPAAHHATIEVRWAESIDATAVADAINRQRIDADTNVSLRVVNFNFLHYTLKFTVEERTVESYALLDQIWSQIFGLAGLATGAPLTERGGFDGAVFNWRFALMTAADQLSRTLQKYAGKTWLTDTECKEIASSKDTVGVDHLAKIEKLRQEVLAQVDDGDKLDTYESLISRHDDLASRLKSFITAADLVQHGQEYAIGRKKAGTVVTFTIAPVDAQQAQAGQPFQGSYFVRSRHPLMLHVGYAAGRIDEVDFEKVRSISGADLFLSTQSDENTQALVTFLSYELANYRPSANVGLQLVLGTSFQHPGDALYVGAGLRLNKFIFTFGGQSQTVTTGEQKVGESIPGIDPKRDLYASIIKNRDWARFFAVSIRVY